MICEHFEAVTKLNESFYSLILLLYQEIQEFLKAWADVLDCQDSVLLCVVHLILDYFSALGKDVIFDLLLKEFVS